MRVAVTGGRGFIGSHLVEQLAEQGHEPVVLDLIDEESFDVTRPFALPPDSEAVIHLAGVLGTHELFDEPHWAVEVNVKGTLNVLEAAHAAKARYVGITMPRVFPSIYTATKVAAAELERAYHHTYGLPVSRVCAYNVFGPGQKLGPGHPQKLIPTFADRAWRGEPLPIWGDGEQTVDLLDVSELASLLIGALDHGDNLTIDGGTGLAWTVNQVAEAVLEFTGSEAGTEHLPMRRGEIPTRIVAEGRGWDRLGWQPMFDNEVFKETVLSYRPQAEELAA